MMFNDPPAKVRRIRKYACLRMKSPWPQCASEGDGFRRLGLDGAPSCLKNIGIVGWCSAFVRPTLELRPMPPLRVQRRGNQTLQTSSPLSPLWPLDLQYSTRLLRQLCRTLILSCCSRKIQHGPTGRRRDFPGLMDIIK